MYRALKTALREPLIQFLLLGLMVFAADRLMLDRQDDPRRIVIDDRQYAEIAGIFEDNQGHPPSPEQMSDLTIKWAQNEVLYREARLMGLDKGDEMIRERLILKLRNVLFDRVADETPADDVLRAWYEAHREHYDRPETFDFEQFRVARLDEDDAEAKARELAERLGQAKAGEEWKAALREYARRPAANIADAFGPRGADELVAAPDNAWQAVRSSSGWHLARITARYPAEPVDFERARRRIIEDWKARNKQDQLAEALHEIAQRYDIRIELSTPPGDWDADRIREARLAFASGQ